MTGRRKFLSTSALALGAMGSPLLSAHETAKPTTNPKPQLKLLILGGTGFLGPHTVQAALDCGHEITLFNRGVTNPRLFPKLEKLQGDREGDFDSLAGRAWDGVIDTSGYVPRIVGKSAALLADSVEQYVFISTISVYADFSKPGLNEDSSLATTPDPSSEQVTGATYGPLKALSEQAVAAALPNRATILRPGLIAGPGDGTDRFTYWPARLKRGGDVLAPGKANASTQFIDVRDLAMFIIRTLEQRLIGTFNTDRPARSLSMRQMLNQCQRGTGSKANLVWCDHDFLNQYRVRPWSDMPLWMPSTGPNAGFGEVDCSKAEQAGLAIRSVAKTAKDTLDWFHNEPPERQTKLRAGLSESREASLLKRLRER